MPSTGLLLVNLGTPDSPSRSDVRRYLREFLSDPRVLDIGALRRFFVLNLFILPTRPKSSAEAYEAIWTEEGSPLLVYGEQLRDAVAARFSDLHVELAMRYQNPSIRDALERMREKGVESLIVFPLFPQYSSAAWGSAVEKVYVEAGRFWNVPSLRIVPPYYDHPAFIRAFADVIRPHLDDLEPDRVVMSYHGLPERHLIKSDGTGGNHCLQSDDCCARITDKNRYCYRAHCMATTRALREALDLPEEKVRVAFQSRLGKDPWMTPYTDRLLLELAEEGVKRVAVCCPAFVADCLETLEEIGMQAKESFEEAGGEELRLVPSLNATEGWIDAVCELVGETLEQPVTKA